MWTDKHSRQRIFNYNFPNGFEGVTLMIRGSWLDVSFSSHVKSVIRAIWLALGFFHRLVNGN